MPGLACDLEAKYPRGDGVHEDGDGQGEARYDGHLRSIGPFAAHEHQVEDVDDDVAGDDDHVPHQGAGEVGAGEHAPDALDAAQVDEHADARAADAHQRADHGGKGNGLELLDVEDRGGGGNDEAACGESHEEHEAGEVQAPGGGVVHAGDSQAVGQLVHPQAKPDRHQGDKRDERGILKELLDFGHFSGSF